MAVVGTQDEEAGRCQDHLAAHTSLSRSQGVTLWPITVAMR